jgi:hypothetical protein
MKLKLVFHDQRRPYLLDISSLLYDFELLHDFSLILGAENYSDYKFSRYFWYRKGRPIKESHRIRVVRIIKDSPLTIELLLTGIVACPTALWLFVQMFEKVSNWKLNRKKLELETEKLKLDNEIKRIKLERKVQQRQVFDFLQRLIKRFEGNPIKLEDLEIEVEESNDEKEKIVFS